ncbi:MAG TPA: Gfo/Idh/MocA family oxidoreductase, partial [Chloroflexota bacterium]|nr:Gfo/Idh/MocA family oxidoreductase [Chloroflexota bacterium]
IQTEREEDWRKVELDLKDPFGRQLAAYLSGIVTGQPVHPDFEDAVINMRLIKAAYRSAAERREVSLREVEGER